MQAYWRAAHFHGLKHVGTYRIKQTARSYIGQRLVLQGVRGCCAYSHLETRPDLQISGSRLHSAAASLNHRSTRSPDRPMSPEVHQIIGDIRSVLGPWASWLVKIAFNEISRQVASLASLSAPVAESTIQASLIPRQSGSWNKRTMLTSSPV